MVPSNKSSLDDQIPHPSPLAFRQGLFVPAALVILLLALAILSIERKDAILLSKRDNKRIRSRSSWCDTRIDFSVVTVDLHHASNCPSTLDITYGL